MADVNYAFEANPKSKGSYRRASDDVSRALNTLNIDTLSDVDAFLYCYFACEKLAKIAVAVCAGKEGARDFFNRVRRTPNSEKIYSCLCQLGFEFAEGKTDEIFGENPRSARTLRNQFVHKLGPTHAQLLVQEAPHLVPTMSQFVDCRGAIANFLDAKARETTG